MALNVRQPLLHVIPRPPRATLGGEVDDAREGLADIKSSAQLVLQRLPATPPCGENRRPLQRCVRHFLLDTMFCHDLALRIPTPSRLSGPVCVSTTLIIPLRSTSCAPPTAPPSAVPRSPSLSPLSTHHGPARPPNHLYEVRDGVVAGAQPAAVVVLRARHHHQVGGRVAQAPAHGGGAHQHL